jgi:YHS domain-containing protein
MRLTLAAAGILLASFALGSEDAKRTAGALKPWEPVDPAFNGCSEGVCGRRGHNPQAVAQPGAKVGQTVYCPVSGAVFEVKESSRRVDLDGKPLYLCCEACARYFAANREQVLALRGLGPRGSSGN